MNFIKYYAIKYLKIKDLIVEYSLIIIDNNCNYIDNLSHKDTIVLYENKYELNNTDTNTQSNKKIFEIHKTEENKPKVSF